MNNHPTVQSTELDHPSLYWNWVEPTLRISLKKGRPTCIQQWGQLACTSSCGCNTCKCYVGVVYNVRVVSLWVTPGHIL